MPLRWSPADEELVEGKAKVLTRAPTGPGRLFGMGRVDVEMFDSVGRSLALRIIVPVLVLHGAMPVLLGHGLMEQYSVAAPLGALVPTIDSSRIVETDTPQVVADSLNRAMRECAFRAIELFRVASHYCADPSDAVAMLPLGTYVSFLFRSSCDKAWDTSDKLRTTPGLGVSDLGTVLASVLSDAGALRTGALPVSAR